MRQHGDTLELTIESDADPAVVAAQVGRIISCTPAAEDFAALGARDSVIGALQAAAPGLRPVLFHSPYEAAVWAIISARRARGQGIGLRERLNREQGRVLDVAGAEVSCLPAPRRLLELDALPGLPADRLPRLHAVARRAIEGGLGVDHLTALGQQAAEGELQTLPGIGPFYSQLISVRATGLDDALPTAEPTSRALIADLYGVDAGADEALRTLAEGWRPVRAWAMVLVRAAAQRLPSRGLTHLAG